MKNSSFLFTALLLFVLSGCTEVIDLNLNDEKNQRLVVEGWITNESKSHTVFLSKTISYFAKEVSPRVQGAIVSISDGTLNYPLTESAPGIYKTAANVAGKIGKTYTLTIITEGKEYTASAYLDTIARLDSVNYEPPTPAHDTYTILMNAQEIAGMKNYYLWKMYKNNVLETDTLRELAFTDDMLVDGSYISDFPLYDDYEMKIGDTIRVEMLSISKANHDYFIALMLETDWKGGPFDAPPANVPGNISNGALGFFGASAVSAKEVVIK